ncbi:MAG: glucose-6-phosphate isomerase [Firmicutes bacterium]|nr:glucose-6-phosphate isomerase [Bacillota bacterium]MDD3298111.1 glucose-6-phosphate isomerase [Bacillota bacterium]MDD3851148.1 glucose-6-phosphate isomerase [Bacillota bacterium]MDD4707434.1 glucose-6-phosphate isomerase [Bacillota bacterium]
MGERIRLDYSNMLKAVPAVEEEIEKARPELISAVESVEAKRNEGLLGFFNLPFLKEDAAAIKETAEHIKDGYESLVVIGIGGSALGNRLLHAALNHPWHNKLSNVQRKGCPRVYVLDSIDSDHLNGLLDILDLNKTAFNVITKSGSTVETMANYLILKDLLEREVGPHRAAKSIIATTDASRGSLLQIARRSGYRLFYIPGNVGGRYSVLSAVGLLSAAVSGIDIEELLSGAAQTAGECTVADPYQNPALMGAALQYIAYKKGKNISVVMPYSDALDYFGDWYCQLWAESLGKIKESSGRKEQLGQTPIKAIGARDQHSLLQLFLDGPDDKIFTLIEIERRENSFVIPEPGEGGIDLQYLSGSTLEKLLQSEFNATESVLTKRGRMNYKISLPQICAHTIGQLIFLYMLMTAYMGELFGVNAFDQPAVEEGKKITYRLMGRPGY